MHTLFASGIIEKIIKAVRDLADAVTPRPTPVPVPIPVRAPQPRLERRYRSDHRAAGPDYNAPSRGSRA
jgi:hypothetical protein